ncbi:MAG: DUF349 domain-containing protein [Vicinamibacteria bacterium]|nr:DUF349 domain-containing protein [Vicinamibacteria bacterium]
MPLATILDRFRRKPPAWEAEDPVLRASAVRNLTEDHLDVARSLVKVDPDARVRRAALARLMPDLGLALEVLRGDAETAVRSEAQEALLKMALESGDDAVARPAAAALVEPRVLLAISRDAKLEGVRDAALLRITDERALATLSKTAPHPKTRMDALLRVQDPALRLDVALKCEHKDVAAAAAESLTSEDALRSVAERGRAKSAQKKARSRLATLFPPPAPAPVIEPEPEPEPQAEPATPEPSVAAVPAATPEPAADRTAAIAEREAFVTRAQGLQSTAADTAAIEALRHEWQALPATDGAEAAAVAERFTAACAAAHQAAQEREQAEARRPQLEEKLAVLERIAAAEAPTAEERRQAGDLRREWERSAPVPRDLDERFKVVSQALLAKSAAEREEREQKARENVLKCERRAAAIEKVVAHEQAPLKDLDHALREIKVLLDNPGPFPGKPQKDAFAERLKAARSALFPRAQEAREADEWSRFSNLGVQEQLVQQVEALVAETDSDKAARVVREIDERWKSARQVPKEEGEALWLRFKAARDQVRARLDEHFAKRAQEFAAARAKREELIARAEALKDSGEWVKTAEELKALQAEWKAAGVLPHKESDALWQRFRAACDAFFSRRKEDLAGKKEAWAKNLERKEALCARAEELAQSADWDAASAELKRLQAEWKTAGPVPKKKSDEIWNRFKAAGDLFFDRYKKRDELTRTAALEARTALVVDLEAFAAAATAGDAREGLEARLTAWRQAPALDGAEAAALQARFFAARAAVVARAPEAFTGTEHDPELKRQRLEKVIAKVEALAATAVEAAPVTADLGSRLREALAQNALGGRGAQEASRRANQDEVNAARQAFARSADPSVPDFEALKARFEAACRKAQG